MKLRAPDGKKYETDTANTETLFRRFDENKAAAKTGGKIAGDARRQLELLSGKPVISKENRLDHVHFS